MGRAVVVNDKMQHGYHYVLSAPTGRDFDLQFRPDLTPRQMLELGVFCGKYLTDCRDEFPASWFARAKLSPSGRDCLCNYFGVDASQRLSEWRRKGWIHPNDPRGLSLIKTNRVQPLIRRASRTALLRPPELEQLQAHRTQGP